MRSLMNISSIRALLFCLFTANVALAFTPLQLTHQQRTLTTTNLINGSASRSQITTSTQLSVASEVVANGVAAKLKKSRQVSDSDDTLSRPKSRTALICRHPYCFRSRFFSNAYKKRRRDYRSMSSAYRFTMHRSKYEKS